MLAADPQACRAALGLSAAQDAEIARNSTLWTSPTMPALHRYTGVLYDALDVGSLRGAAAGRARARLAVGSALFGLLRADDPVLVDWLSGQAPRSPRAAHSRPAGSRCSNPSWPPSPRRSWWWTCARAPMPRSAGCRGRSR